MSHGLANVITLYDKAGNAIEVSLINGKYKLEVSESVVVQALGEISAHLRAIDEKLELMVAAIN